MMLQPCLILSSLRYNCYLQPAPPLSSQHSLALLISLKAVLAFLQNGQNYYIAPTPSTHQPLALLFCTTGRSCIFAERSHYIYFCRKGTAHAHFCRIVKTHICISLHCWTHRTDEGEGSDDEEEEELACRIEEGDHLPPPGRPEGLADLHQGARRF